MYSFSTGFITKFFLSGYKGLNLNNPPSEVTVVSSFFPSELNNPNFIPLGPSFTPKVLI